MLIALDYDGTYTRDPVAWDKFIDLFTSVGHTVICVTMRRPDETVADLDNIKVYYTSRQAKLPFCNDVGIKPDIWIDDCPLWLFQNG